MTRLRAARDEAQASLKHSAEQLIQEQLRSKQQVRLWLWMRDGLGRLGGRCCCVPRSVRTARSEQQMHALHAVCLSAGGPSSARGLHLPQAVETGKQAVAMQASLTKFSADKEALKKEAADAKARVAAVEAQVSVGSSGCSARAPAAQ